MKKFILVLIIIASVLGLLFAVLPAIADSPTVQGITTVSIQEIGHIKDAQTQNGSAQVLKRPKGLCVAGNYAYVDSRDDSGLSIIDISNASNPIEVGYIQDNSIPGGKARALLGAYGLCVSGNYAYVAAVYDDALSVIDVSNPASPTEVSYIQDRSHPNGTATAFDQPIGVFISGNYAYVNCHGAGDGLSIINISDPYHPTQEGYIQDNSHNGTATALHYPDAVWVTGNYAYVITSADDSLSVIDISNSSNPVEVGYILDDESPETGEKAAHCLDLPIGLYVSGNYAYVGSRFDSALTIIDISDPTNLVEVGYIQDDDPIVDNDATDYPAGEATALWYANGVFLSGDYAYVTSYEDAVSVFDISDPTDPRELAYIYDDSSGGSATTLQDANRISLANGYIYVTAYGEDGFSILSPSITTYWPGDVNGDGRINCIDITQCELCILYPLKYPKENYLGWDANEDGEGPSAGDILAVELRILGLWPPLPQSTPSPSPTATSSPSLTPTASPTPSLSPTASPTPIPSPTPEGQGFTVTETSSYRSVRTPAQRSNFYANGRYWVFYETTVEIYYRSSATGQNWSSPTLVEVEDCPFKYGAMFSVWESNGYVHFVFAPLKGGTPAGNISYRRGELNVSGDISWDPAQIVYACPSTHRIGDPVITVSGDGYPFIAASIYYHNGTTSNVTVFKSSTSNGTWAEDWAANISSGAGILLPSLTPLGSDDILCTYYSASAEGDQIKARLWNGSDWETEEICTDEGIPKYSFSSYSVVAINSTVHLVYLGNISHNLSYVCRDPVSGWGSEELIYHNSSSWQTAPALSRLGDDVYCFWLDDTGGGWIFYKMLSNGSWGDRVNWILESAPFTLNYTIQSSYDLTSDVGGVLYQVNTSSPYQIKFGREAF